MTSGIIIIEPNGRRAESIAHVFAGCGCSLYVITDRDEVRQWNAPPVHEQTMMRSIDDLPVCRLAMIHKTFLDSCVPPKRRAALWMCPVFYSTTRGAGQTQETDGNWQYWIYNEVRTHNPGFSSEEAKELYDWAEERDRTRIPAILQPPVALVYLPALAIACQGFLAIRARKRSDASWGPAALENALKRMRWREFIDGPYGAVVEIDNRKPEVLEMAAPVHWKDNVFGGQPFDNDLLKAEWNSMVPADSDYPAIVEEFAGIIDGHVRVSPRQTMSIVAGAYVAIVDRLEGKR